MTSCKPPREALDSAWRGWEIPSCMQLKAALLSAILLTLAASGPAAGEPTVPPATLESTPSEGLGPLETLVLVGQVLRVRYRSQVIPNANFGASSVDRWSPELQVRVRFPIVRNTVGQLLGRFRSERYDFGGADIFRGQAPAGLGLENFYMLSIALEAAHAVDFMPQITGGDEVWSIVGGVRTRSRWQPGAFRAGLTGGGFLGLSYELSGTVRLAAGVSIESRLGRGGAVINPVGTLAWRISDQWTLRSRGVGAQIEYRVVKPVTLFATVHRDTAKFALDVDVSPEDPLVFRDRTKALLGGGFDWQITPYVRLVAEAGAVLSRNLQLRSGGDSRIRSDTAGTHGYFELRLYAGGVGTARALDSGARR